MRIILTVVLYDGTERDIEVRAPGDTELWRLTVFFPGKWIRPAASSEDGQEEAGASFTLPAADVALWVGGVRLPGMAKLADSPLRDGIRVGFGRPAEDAPAQGEFELRVVGGEGAGTVTSYNRSQLVGSVDLLPGRPDVKMYLGNGDRPVVLGVDADTGIERIAGFGQSAFRWPEGYLLRVDSSWVDFVPVPEADPEPRLISPGPGGTLLFVRPRSPRPTLIGFGAIPYEFHDEPWWRSRRSRVRREAQRQEARLRRFRTEKTAERRHQTPDAAEVLAIAVRRDRRLWERRPDDPDYLVLRCGLDVDTPPPVEETAVPLAVSLREHGVVGVAGPGDRPRRMAAWFAAQAVVLHGPEDVVVQVFTDAAGAPDWRWLRWPPRSSSALDEDDLPRVFADAAAQAHQVGRLLALLNERQRSEDGSGHRGPDVLLVLESAGRLRTQPGIGRLLREGPAAGVYVICVESQARALPPVCGVLLHLDEGEQIVIAENGGQVDFVPDLVPWPWFDQVGRALAPLRDAAVEQRAQDLRESPLPELLGLEPPDARTIAARWNAVPRATAVTVGQADGSPFELDLRRHGPHALVAGTTGSGKTEFLRTWVVSLAVANRPDEMMFVLVDYKGGAAFGPLARLPHVTSVIADLDGRQVTRILNRLGAELRAREFLLATHGAKSIEDYLALRDRRRHDLEPLPRLVFVVDEFAPLSRELPELVRGLLAVAQRGRSLGVHLVLATQRPSGVLSSDLLATTNLRIALRLGHAEESRDIIQAPDAARIRRSSPGRAFVRTGTDDLVEFQAARVSGIPGPGASADLTIRVMDDTGALPPLPTPPFPDDPQPSDLDRLVAAVRDAAVGMPVVPGPLPPPLPDIVTLSELPEPPGGSRDLAPVAFGVEEVPDELAQRAAVFDVTAGGALAAAGGPRSGRSQFLRTLAAAIARRHSTADVHLFGIDCGDGALQALTALPHCGAVVTRSRPRIARLLGRLTAAVYSRQQLLAAGGFGDVAAQRQAVPAAQRLPYLVLLLDRWESFEALSEDEETGQFTDDLYRLLRDGSEVGVRVVLTGEPRLLTGRMASLVQHQLVLDFADREDYARVGLDPQSVPDHLNPGRAFRAHSAVELQIALLDGGPNTRGQTDALDRLAAGLRERDAQVPDARRPFRIDDAPRAAEQFHVGPGKGRPVGREDVLAWLRDRHTTGASAALLGPRRAGKTWVLEELSRRLRADGFREVRQLVVPQPSSKVDSPDALAAILDHGVRDADSPAEALLDKARAGKGSTLVFLLDEVGRLVSYDPAAVSWLRDLGQAGAWLVYTGTEKDWHAVVSWALTSPGSSFGNDVNARTLGPLDREAALDFLSGTAANLGVDIARDTAATRIVETVGTWPFYLQVVGDAVVRAAQSNDLTPLTGTDALHTLVDAVLLDEWTHHFKSRWAEIGPAGRAALLATPGTMPRSATPAQRGDLRDVGLLRPGEKWLDDPPFLQWIARNNVSLQDGELPA